MKKILAVIMMCMIVFGLTACGGAKEKSGESANANATEATEVTTESETGDETSSDNEDGQSGKSLIVYFSATGNTEAVAEIFAEEKNLDIYEIVPEQPYTDADLDYNDSSSRSTVEQNDENARPAISGSIENIEDYDVIYVGFPIWWGDMPRILYTFFDNYDLSGKTIAPFATSGGSGISGAVESIRELEPEGTVTEGLLTSASNAESDLNEWLGSIGLEQ